MTFGKYTHEKDAPVFPLIMNETAHDNTKNKPRPKAKAPATGGNIRFAVQWEAFLMLMAVSPKWLNPLTLTWAQSPQTAS